MKKLVLSLCLFFGISHADSPINTDSEVGKWKRYFGIEGGVGLMDIEPAFVVSLNYGFLNATSLRGLSYGGSILGGWQKDTGEKRGMRHTIGAKVFVAPKTKTLRDRGIFGEDFTKTKDNVIAETTIYYALDGLFDFVKNGNHRFGFIAGFSANFSLNLGRADGANGIFAPRLGFYTQFDDNAIDCIISVPLLGLGVADVSFNSTLTLGYKHFF